VLLTVVLIAACALLVPAYGLVGAAVAMAIANGVQLLGLGVLLWSAIAKPANAAEIMEGLA
jgi:Na+-driven multidrug efflux pump